MGLTDEGIPVKEQPRTLQKSKLRSFDTGATRDSEEGKLDFEGFLSPLALEAYARYMDRHRKQTDGSLRDSDNWQAGMDKSVYLKSLWRHFFAAWKIHRGGRIVDERDGHDVTVQEALCGVLFNAFGYLHEMLKENSHGV